MDGWAQSGGDWIYIQLVFPRVQYQDQSCRHLYQQPEEGIRRTLSQFTDSSNLDGSVDLLWGGKALQRNLNGLG